MSDPFAPIGSGDRSAGARQDDSSAWTAILPVPADAPPPPATHWRHGAPSASWIYRDGKGRSLGIVLRFDLAEGEKEFFPLSYCRSVDGRSEWQWKALPVPRPLYGLDRLAARPDAPVVVTEGEKAADAAGRLLPNYVAVTSSGGSKAAGKADWSPLAGRTVVIWPDADAPGADYAAEAARRIDKVGAASITIARIPAEAKAGFDAADAEAEGWTKEQALSLVAAASATPLVDDAGKSAVAPRDGRRRTPQRDVLIGLTEFCELWHDKSGDPFVSMPINGHVENWPVRATRFRRWLADRYFEETGTVIGSQALEDGLRILEARAGNHGPEHDIWLRVGRLGDSLYLDLGDAAWRAVEISVGGWSVVTKPPVKFMRSPAMYALPDPEAGVAIEKLRNFINVRSDEDFTLIVAWLVAALRERGPYPVLILNGEQGSGKSGVTRLLRALIDPAKAAIRAAPREDRDLVVSASNNWTLALDNLSTIPSWLSDSLCRLSTGGGFATRMLHTDREEAIFEASRPILLNGIPLLAERPDLADRAITVHLPAIPESARMAEEDFWRVFEAARPGILGALLDAVASALRNLPTTRLSGAPRLADFAKWITAAEPGLGWEPGAFMATYNANRREVSESAFEADPVAMAIKAFVEAEHPHGWHGTPSALLEALNNRTPEGLRKTKVWPMHPQALGNRIDRVAPLLRSKGFAIERRRSGIRTISIVPPPKPAP